MILHDYGIGYMPQIIHGFYTSGYMTGYIAHYMNDYSLLHDILHGITCYSMEFVLVPTVSCSSASRLVAACMQGQRGVAEE